jgi:hypothetical protein
MAKRGRKVGVIAEDDSDVDCVEVLIRRLTNNAHIGIKHYTGKGCGKIRRKCHAWSEQLKQRGCSLLVLIHDRDDNNIRDLLTALNQALNPCPIATHLICIPVQEFEAWLLGDPDAIKNAMHLDNVPRIRWQPETINAPKEYLGRLIDRVSKGEKIYIHTKHNPKITQMLSIDLVRSKCPSFAPFYDFVQLNLCNWANRHS